MLDQDKAAIKGTKQNSARKTLRRRRFAHFLSYALVLCLVGAIVCSIIVQEYLFAISFFAGFISKVVYMLNQSAMEGHCDAE